MRKNVFEKDKQVIVGLLRQDRNRIEILKIVRDLELPDCFVAAGFIRNLVWDWLHSKCTPLTDIDVIYFDSSDVTNKRQFEIQTALDKRHPSFNWDVKNQAFMHTKNKDRPYVSCLDSMSFWPEKETAIGARMTNKRHITLVSAFNLDGLLSANITHNKRKSKQLFLDRIEKKEWLKNWPKLKVVL